MPALLPAPGAIEIQFSHTVQGRAWSSRLFYSDGHALEYSDADLAAIGVAADSSWATNVMPIMSEDCTYTGLVATDLFSDTAPRDEETGSTAGGVAHTALPINVCAVVKRVQARRYRGGKSHVYLSGISETDLSTDNTWISGFDVAASSAFNAHDAAIAALTSSHGSHYFPVVVSRFSGKVERGAPVLFPIMGNATEMRVCTRRRRLPKIAG